MIEDKLASIVKSYLLATFLEGFVDSRINKSKECDQLYIMHFSYLIISLLR